MISRPFGPKSMHCTSRAAASGGAFSGAGLALRDSPRGRLSAYQCSRSKGRDMRIQPDRPSRVCWQSRFVCGTHSQLEPICWACSVSIAAAATIATAVTRRIAAECGCEPGAAVAATAANCECELRMRTVVAASLLAVAAAVAAVEWTPVRGAEPSIAAVEIDRRCARAGAAMAAAKRGCGRRLRLRL